MSTIYHQSYHTQFPSSLPTTRSVLNLSFQTMIAANFKKTSAPLNQRWHLHFNSSKFRLIQFHSNTANSSNTHSYIINGQTIESSTSHKDLGIFLTDTVNWEEHYHCISLRAYKQLGLLWRTFRSIYSSISKERIVSFLSKVSVGVLLSYLEA